MLAHFEKSREKNRQIAEEQGETSKSVELSLLEFDKHSHMLNDAYALRIRLKILLQFLFKNFVFKYELAILVESE